VITFAWVTSPFSFTMTATLPFKEGLLIRAASSRESLGSETSCGGLLQALLSLCERTEEAMKSENRVIESGLTSEETEFVL
jgi:hypothetical protein